MHQQDKEGWASPAQRAAWAALWRILLAPPTAKELIALESEEHEQPQSAA